MKKIERLQNIIYLLSQHKRMSARDLAEHFEVSLRTIYRDIDALCQMKVPITAYEGIDGGYELEQSYFFQSVQLNSQELMIMLLLLEVGTRLNTTDYDEAIRTLKSKLLNAAALHSGMEKAVKRIMVDIQDIYPQRIKDGVFSQITKALQIGSMLRIDYYSPLKGQWSLRSAAPLALFYCEGCWYLDAYCQSRNAQRTFRLDRIRTCEILNERVPDTLYDQYEQNPSGNPVSEVIIQIDTKLFEAVKDDAFMQNAEILRSDDHQRVICVKTTRLGNVETMAFRNAEQVLVLSPPELVASLRKKSHIMQQNYQ